MQADQVVYLYPSRVDLLGSPAMVVGEHPFPDVVLEVDHTTDMRRGHVGLHGLAASERALRGEQLDQPPRRRTVDPGLRLEEGRHGVGGKAQDFLFELLLDRGGLAGFRDAGEFDHRSSGRPEPLGGRFGPPLQS